MPYLRMRPRRARFPEMDPAVKRMCATSLVPCRLASQESVRTQFWQLCLTVKPERSLNRVSPRLTLQARFLPSVLSHNERIFFCNANKRITNTGYGIAVGVIMAISFALGVAAYFRVKGDAANYFVAGHSLPLWMVAVVRVTLASDCSCLDLLLVASSLAYTCFLI
jgi:hypothetical protein